MRIQTSQVRRFAIPVKVWLQRFAFWLLIATAAGIMALGRTETGFTERLRMNVMDFAAPVLDLISRPVATVSDLVDRTGAFIDTAGENARLSEENERLKHWRQTALRLQQENAAMRSVLNVVAEPRATFVTARVIADSRGAFVHAVLLNAGARDEVKKGEAVVNGEGMVGRVMDVGNRSARVLLLTDLNSRVPVVVESTRDPAILAGDNSDRPVLNYLPIIARVAVGERLVTSGQGGMLPPGLPIGVVSEVADGVVRVQPFVRWHQLEYVRVLNYALPGVLPATRFAGPAGSIK